VKHRPKRGKKSSRQRSPMRPGKLLVTGGAGFIGSHLCDRLLSEGYHVLAVDDLSLGREENLAWAVAHPGFRFIRRDILNGPALDEIFAGDCFDAVFHMAANSDIRRGRAETKRDLKLTMLSTFHVLDCMRVRSVKQIIFPSSSAVYGEAAGPIAESYGPLRPVSFYGAAKLASEAYVSAFCHQFGIQAWIFRFPNVVGERATHGVMFDFIARLRENPKKLMILGDGSQSKPYLYVQDLIDAMMLGWRKMDEQVNISNIGVRSATSVTRIAEIVVEEMKLNGVALRYTGGERGWQGDVPTYQYDLSVMHRLGWSSPRTSEEAVRVAVQRCLRG
jgi:UDP-glucose 4-epimerase